MTVDCVWELQKAVFQALDNDSSLSALVTGVYNHVPQDTVYPYIKISSVEAVDWSTKTTSGIKSQLFLDVFSQSRGTKQTLDIIVEIKRVLDGVILSMTGCTMVSSKYTKTDVLQMSDGLTWQGRIGFSFLVQKN